MDGLVIKNVKIIDKTSKHHGKVLDVLIEKGKYSKIEKNLNHKNILDARNSIISQGLMDLRAFIQDPGEEFKEDYKTMNSLGLAGGYTKICVHPDSSDSLQKKQDIEYINTINKLSTIQFIPIAACTRSLEGIDVSEMFDMKSCGAKGFSNGNHPIAHAGVMNRILQYSSNVNTTLFVHAQLDYLVPNWQVHEGLNNIKTGLKGLPNVAESILVNRDLALAKYNEAKIHFSHVSTADTVALIKKAKKDGTNVTADVSIMHLLFNDESILQFDSNYKSNPPLRSKKDQEALISGLKDGTIDAVCTDHHAQDQESKIVEFDQAEFGIASAQWAFSKAFENLSKNIGVERLIESFTSSPRDILNIEQNPIEVGETANFMVFSEKTKWKLDSNTNKSKSTNSPFFDQEIIGKVMACGVNKDITLF